MRVAAISVSKASLYARILGEAGPDGRTDASGSWSVTFNQDAPVADADITINATAIDPLSRPSQPAVVTVKQGNRQAGVRDRGYLLTCDFLSSVAR